MINPELNDEQKQTNLLDMIEVDKKYLYALKFSRQSDLFYTNCEEIVTWENFIRNAKE